MSSPDSTLPAEEFERLLEYLRRTRGADFGGYKRAGLERRVAKRMRAAGAGTVPDYIEHLDTHPDEFAQLCDTILINVTAFFRDDVPWDFLRTDIVPRLIERKQPGDPIRVWSAGCASGQEAYTLAIVFAEALGLDQFRERVKIYATDLDENALNEARHGAYTAADVEGVHPELLEKYFERRGDQYLFRKDLRRTVIFGRNDLMQDAPISRIDLLACRNTLMYFDTAAQAKILARFHFALNDDGFLFLGRAETLLTHNAMFTPVDLRRRVFAKVPTYRRFDRALLLPRADGAGGAVVAEGAEPRLLDHALDVANTPQIVVDRAGRLLSANERARVLFQLGASDVGRPLQDLEVSYRPFELRSAIDQAYAERQTITRAEVPWRSGAQSLRWFDIVVSPLAATGDGYAGASVSFLEVTRVKQLQTQLEQSRAELETAYQELQSTNEELETTNEELHSTVEELETTNEELQSTNEELETMNEELQSTNEELQTINDELRVRSDELNRLNAFLESILTSLRAGIVVIDRDQRVLVWNVRAEEMWGLRADEAEQATFPTLDIGLPVDALRPTIRAVLAGTSAGQEQVLAATNRRGRAIRCKTTAFPLVARGEPLPLGVIVLMDEQPADGERADGAAAATGGASAD